MSNEPVGFSESLLGDEPECSNCAELERQLAEANKKLAEHEQMEKQEPSLWLWKFKDDSDDDWRISFGSCCPTYREECETKKFYAHPQVPDGKVPMPDVDWLSNVIRTSNGGNTLGAGVLAEKIIEAMLKAAQQGE